MATITNEQIRKFEDAGCSYWLKGKYERIYIPITKLGLELDHYKSGNICSARFDGESISNSQGRKLESMKFWVEVATGELHYELGYGMAEWKDAEYISTMMEHALDLMDDIMVDDEPDVEDDVEIAPAREYSSDELEAFLGEFVDDYDLLHIEDEVTTRDYQGRRIWISDYYNDDAKLFSVCERYRYDNDEDILDDVVAEWQKDIPHGDYADLIVEIHYDEPGDREAGVSHRIVPRSDIHNLELYRKFGACDYDDILDGWGTALAFRDQAMRDYTDEASQEAYEALSAANELCRFYTDVRHGNVPSLSGGRTGKMQAAGAWAAKTDVWLERQECTSEDYGGKGFMLYVDDGRIGRYHVQIIYRYYAADETEGSE